MVRKEVGDSGSGAFMDMDKDEAVAVGNDHVGTIGIKNNGWLIASVTLGLGSRG